MNSFDSILHQIDTRENSTLTVFDGSRQDESKLATQFWNSVVLIPPVESTLVCKEIKQRIRSQTIKQGTQKPRFSTTTKTNIKEDKSLQDKLYDEATALQQAKDEAKHVRIIEKRTKQVRELFRQQAKANRIKNHQWISSKFHPHQQSIQNFSNDIEQKQREDDEYDRQLVSSLPD